MDKSLKQLAVLYADVSGSTRLYEQYGDAIARTDLALCIEILRAIANGLNGETLKTIGDEIQVAFSEPVKAALCATEMQAGLRRAGEEGRFQMGVLHIKIGWHYGAVVWRDDEVLGEAPITAQQIIKLAKADEILTSAQAVETLPGPLFPDIHPIEKVPAEAWSGLLEIYKMPWERSGDETQISSRPRAAVTATEIGLLLSYGDIELRIDSRNTRCSVGRGKEASLQVNGRLTSRQHAEISFRNGRFYLRDESTNGCYIVTEDGTRKHLRREEDVLTGRGHIGFGAWPEKDADGSITFDCAGPTASS